MKLQYSRRSTCEMEDLFMEVIQEVCCWQAFTLKPPTNGCLAMYYFAKMKHFSRQLRMLRSQQQIIYGTTLCNCEKENIEDTTCMHAQMLGNSEYTIIIPSQRSLVINYHSYYKYNLQRISEDNWVKIMQDYTITADHSVDHNRPYLHQLLS